MVKRTDICLALAGTGPGTGAGTKPHTRSRPALKKRLGVTTNLSRFLLSAQTAGYVKSSTNGARWHLTVLGQAEGESHPLSASALDHM